VAQHIAVAWCLQPCVVRLAGTQHGRVNTPADIGQVRRARQACALWHVCNSTAGGLAQEAEGGHPVERILGGACHIIRLAGVGISLHAVCPAVSICSASCYFHAVCLAVCLILSNTRHAEWKVQDTQHNCKTHSMEQDTLHMKTARHAAWNEVPRHSEPDDMTCAP